MVMGKKGTVIDAVEGEVLFGLGNGQWRWSREGAVVYHLADLSALLDHEAGGGMI